MADIVEIRRIEDLSPYCHAWAELLRHTPGATFFQSLSWLEVFWNHHTTGRTLRVLMISDDGTLRAIVPLIVERRQTRLGPMRTVTWPLDAWGSFYGPVGTDPSWALGVALDFLRCGRPDWDVIDLPWLGSPTKDDLFNSRGGEGNSDAAIRPILPLSLAGHSAVIDFEGSWDDYLAGRSAHFRRNIRALERRLPRTSIRFERFRPTVPVPRDGSVDQPELVGAVKTSGGDGNRYGALEWVSDGAEDELRRTPTVADQSLALPAPVDPRWDLYEACVQVAQASWQDTAVRGNTLSTPSVASFLRKVHTAALAAGAVDLTLLRWDERPVAFQYNYFFRGTLVGLRRGYDPQYAKYGVGNALMAWTIRDSFDRGDRLLDLGIGSEETKRAWATRTVPIYRLTCYSRRSIGAQVLRLARWCRNCLTARFRF